MCLIAFSYQQHPNYELVFIANRDEFYERPTREARFWDEHPHILAGKDLKEGGTWMGVTRDGNISALTNYRDLENRRKDAPTRGKLVLDYLADTPDPEPYLQQVDSKANKFNGFNLLVGSVEKLMYYPNKTGQPRQLTPGLYGLSNHLLDTPWPKTRWSKQELSDLLQKDNIDRDTLFDILQNEQPAPDNELPDTGISKELEKAVSPIFIKTEQYGTRSSTVLLIHKNGEFTFEERRYKMRSTNVEEVTKFEFRMD